MTMTQIPAALYRGDRDPSRLRRVAEFWSRGWLQTNLGGGGRGSDIFADSLTTLVQAHVHETWEGTHLLSFSSRRSIAERFALGELKKKLEPAADDALQWDTSIFTLDG